MTVARSSGSPTSAAAARSIGSCVERARRRSTTSSARARRVAARSPSVSSVGELVADLAGSARGTPSSSTIADLRPAVADQVLDLLGRRRVVDRDRAWRRRTSAAMSSTWNSGMFRIISTTRSPRLDAQRAQAGGGPGDPVGVLARRSTRPSVVAVLASAAPTGRRAPATVARNAVGDGLALDDPVMISSLRSSSPMTTCPSAPASRDAILRTVATGD